MSEAISKDSKVTLGAAVGCITTVACATIAISSWFTDVHYQLKSMNEKMERMIDTQNGHVERPVLRAYLREMALLNPDLEFPDYNW